MRLADLYARWARARAEPVKAVEALQTSDFSFQSAFIQALLSINKTGDASMAGVEESAAGLLGRTFAMATITGAGARYFPPSVMVTIGRELILTGESVWERNDQLDWVQSFSIKPGDGQYVLSDTRRRSPDQMLHVRYAWDRISEHGSAPLDGAAQLRNAARNLERSLEYEVGSPVAYAVKAPFQQTRKADGSVGENSPLDAFTRQIKNARGDAVFVTSTAATIPQGGAKADEYGKLRVGADIPPTSLDAYERLNRLAFITMGFPASFASGRGMTREDWRLFITATLQPLGRLLQEAAGNCGLNIEISWNDVNSSDLATRARAFKSFIEAGLTKQEAAAVCGLRLEG